MAKLSLQHIYKVYADGTTAVSDFNLEIEDGEFVILVGPSGCGKSTTLRMIAGLEDITAGTFLIGGKRANDLEPKDRKMAMVFQNYALYPHMNVFENMAFGLRINHLDKQTIEERVNHAAQILGLEDQLNKKPKDLSGGQRQRVALGRAIVRKPDVFLLDEPLSNLDAKLRSSMRSEIRRLHDALGSTFIYVTHDQIEAMTMGTKIVVMSKGRIQQVDTPMNLYDFPVNLFVAGFIGTPQMNSIKAQATIQGENVLLDVGTKTLKCPLNRLPKLDQEQIRRDPSLVVGIRPEYLSLEEKVVASAADTLEMEIANVEALGNENLIEGFLPNNERPLVAKIARNDHLAVGQKVSLKIDLDRMCLFSAKSGLTLLPRIPASAVVGASIKGNVLSLLGSHCSIPPFVAELTKSAQQLRVQIPVSAVLEGGPFVASVLQAETFGDKKLLSLLSSDGERFFAFAESSFAGQEFHFHLALPALSFLAGSQVLLEAIPALNHLPGKLIPKKRLMPSGKHEKMRKKKVFAYGIEGSQFDPSPAHISQIYALLGRKFALHDIDFAFHPEEVHLGEQGLLGQVVLEAFYDEDNRFLKVQVGAKTLYVALPKDAILPTGKEVHLVLEPDTLEVTDLNFGVRLL
jgi:multiple sugar transport system ATP-binding protein